MAKQKEILKPNPVNAPTLFVGVGGTGCSIVKMVADLCAPEEKENINFLCLDTNVNDLGDVSGGKSKIYAIQTSTTQTVGSYLDYDDEARKKWFPKNAVMYDKTVSEGAGQVRAISRLALNATIKTGKIHDLYAAIDDLFRKSGKPMKQAMRVVIASTASGGTGSGIILPLSMYIRDYVKEKYPNTSLIVRGLILLPETLDSVITSQTEKDSQARNAYATIKEINAFMMKGSGFFNLDEDLKQFKGLHVDVAIAGSDRQKRLSCLPMDFCFLMDGQDAEDSTMIKLDQYKEQAARALYEQNIGPMQKKAFSVEDNIIKELTKPGNYGRNRFGGIGAGVIRYPYEKVVEYVAYDLAVDSIGGEGEATKWTKYDNAVRAYQAEQKKRGIPMSAWDPDGKIYADTLLNARDPFSRDLVNTYELDTVEDRITEYIASLSDMAYQSVITEKSFRSQYESASVYEGKQRFETRKKKISSACSTLANYRGLVEKVGKDGNPVVKTIAARWAESVFTDDRKALAIQDSYSIEALLKNARGEFMHPCAVRFVLYRLLEEFLEKMADGEVANAKQALDGLKKKEYNKRVFKFAKSPETGVEKLRNFEKDSPSFSDKLHGYKKLYAVANKDITAYYIALKDYLYALAKQAVFEKGYKYLKGFIEEFENFFKSFVYKVKDIGRCQMDLVDELRFAKGDSVVNVCATEELLDELSRFSLQKIQKESTLLNSDINSDIFDAVKNNALFRLELQDTGDAYIDEDRRKNIFDDILIGYFRDCVREKCDDIDKDIVSAIELELRLKERLRLRSESDGETQPFEQVSLEDAKHYIKQVFEMGKRIAAPSIQRLNFEESREISECAYNRSLLDNRRIRVKELFDGQAVDSVSKYEIHFYNALYNLTPDNIKKFAAPYETETGRTEAGTYHRAYFEYAKLIGPDSTKNAAISTHIDKRWDSIKCMPELDFRYQDFVIKRIHKAFIYGIVHKAIQQRALSAVANGKKVFLYRDSDNRDVELVVPNGTMCDEFYEILDALYVNSKVVEDIGVIKARKRAVSDAKNCNYEETEFFRDMADFNLIALIPGCENAAKEMQVYDGTQKSLDAVKNEIRVNREGRSAKKDEDAMLEDDGKAYVENPTSLFCIPLLYYCSLPNSARFISEITTMVESVIDVFREEYAKWEKEEDGKFMLCNRLTDELNLLNRNYHFFREHMHAPSANENPVIDIIQRKIRDVIIASPEPEDYEMLLDRVAKEFRENS